MHLLRHAQLIFILAAFAVLSGPSMPLFGQLLMDSTAIVSSISETVLPLSDPVPLPTEPVFSLTESVVLTPLPLSILPQFPGGFIENVTSAVLRPILTQSQIQSFLPSTRDKFTFPAPYNTEGIRLTIAGDCGGADCVNYAGYSYWRNINNHVGSDTMLIFLGLDRTRGGVGPTLFSYNKVTDQVTDLGALFDPASIYSWHSAEGWYFSATQPTKLYVYNNGPTLLRYDVLAKTFETVFDISAQFGTDKYIFQVHSSNDDRVHSFTLRQTGTWEMLGCAVYREDTLQFSYYPKIGAYDECQIDKSGGWLLIKEALNGAFTNGEDNRIIDLRTGSERVQLATNGAVGHSDNGYGSALGVDVYSPLPNSVRLFDFAQDPLLAPVVFHNNDWSVMVPGHISYTDAQSAALPDQQYACASSANSLSSWLANEIMCFRLDASLNVLVIAPVMTDLNAPGGGDNYGKMPKGNVDVSGQYFIWTSNMGGSRLDAFIVKIPAQLLTSITPAPAPDTTPPVISAVAAPLTTSSGATVTWTTDEAGDSQVEYGPTAAYGSSTPLNTSLVTSHSQTLSGLAASTLYHYRVKSRDAAGNLATSGDSTFTPLAAAAPTTLTVTKGGSGDGTVTATGINCGTDCSETYNSGTSVTLTASASSGSSFSGWSGGECSGTGTCMVLLSATASVKATFSKTYTDDPITSQSTLIKAAHITELRQAINTLRSNNSLSVFSFTDSTLSAGSNQVRKVHITELRTALDAVYDAQSKTRPTYADPTIAAGQTTIKKAHITEIRSNIKAVE